MGGSDGSDGSGVSARPADCGLVAGDIGLIGVTIVDRKGSVGDFGFSDIPLKSDGSHVEGVFVRPAHREAASMVQHNVNRVIGGFGVVRPDGP